MTKSFCGKTLQLKKSTGLPFPMQGILLPLDLTSTKRLCLQTQTTLAIRRSSIGLYAAFRNVLRLVKPEASSGLQMVIALERLVFLLFRLLHHSVCHFQRYGHQKCDYFAKLLYLMLVVHVISVMLLFKCFVVSPALSLIIKQ